MEYGTEEPQLLIERTAHVAREPQVADPWSMGVAE